jgi:GT2 family glycosyltransferase
MLNTPQTTMQTDLPEALPASSLVICSRNRPQLLLESVHSILAGEIVPTEIIIVDQSDERNLALEALATERGDTIRYVWSQSVGLSRANNIGVAHAAHAIIAFTHDDVVVPPSWYGELIAALCAAGPRSVVTGQVLPTPDAGAGGFAPSTKVDSTPAVYAGRIGIDVLFPMNMAMERAALAAVGGFDERLGPGTPFPAAEDNDFGYRLLEAGYRICYVPTAALYHRAWRQPRDYLPLRWNYGRGQGAYYAKYLDLHDRYMLRRMAANFKNHCLEGLRQIRSQRHRAYGCAIYNLGLLSGAAQWLLMYGKARHAAPLAHQRTQ